METPRTEIDVRRSMILHDALKAASKSRFDPTKLIKVCITYYYPTLVHLEVITMHASALLWERISNRMCLV